MTNLLKVYPPWMNSAPTSERDKKNIQTPYFRTYSWHALFNIPQNLHGDRARRAHPKNCQPFFNPIHSFLTSGQNGDFCPLNKFKYRLTPLRSILLVNQRDFVWFCCTSVRLALTASCHPMRSHEQATIAEGVKLPVPQKTAMSKVWVSRTRT